MATQVTGNITTANCVYYQVTLNSNWGATGNIKKMFKLLDRSQQYARCKTYREIHGTGRPFKGVFARHDLIYFLPSNFEGKGRKSLVYTSCGSVDPGETRRKDIWGLGEHLTQCWFEVWCPIQISQCRT